MLKDIEFTQIIKKLVENITDWVLITDSEGRIVYVNKAVEKISGYSAEELIGKTPRVLKSGYHHPGMYEKLWNTIKQGNIFNCLCVNRRKNGSLFYLDHTIVPIKSDGEIIAFVSFARDLTSLEFYKSSFLKSHYIDPVTETLTLKAILGEIEIQLSQNPQERASLMICDIIDFSYINKEYGLEKGDKILKEIANRLTAVLNKNKKTLLGRTGGDEFLVFLKNPTDDEVIRIVQNIQIIFKTPFEMEDLRLELDINMGISTYPYDGSDAESLYGNATLALKMAKSQGANVCVFYNNDLECQHQSKKRLREEILEAISERRFILYGQPYFSIADRKMVGIECLLRLRKKDGTISTPSEFIDFLESSNQMESVNEIIFDELIKFITSLRISPIPIPSINLSPSSLRDKNIIDKLRYLRSALGMPFVVEITERAFIESVESGIISKIKDMDIQIAIDDFGIGYSSLSYITQFPVDLLKIDINFTKNILKDAKAFAVVDTIINLAKRLRIKTLAEGIETREQLNILTAMGCDYGQGYYFCKPMPLEAELIFSKDRYSWFQPT